MGTRKLDNFLGNGKGTGYVKKKKKKNAIRIIPELNNYKRK